MRVGFIDRSLLIYTSMLAISPGDTEIILSEADSGSADSNLGFFSRPYRINYKGKELMLKRYSPISNYAIVSSILENHDRYISALGRIGIRIPDTIIEAKKTKGKYQIFILQEAFSKADMFRTKFETSDARDLPDLCRLIYDDVVKFISNKERPVEMGFHPTLRNYALQNGSLFFFDTFPPMLMSQAELNRIVVRMSPYGSFFRHLIPVSRINMVTNEYYNTEKMFTGITGSCCRLRPEQADAILKFSIGYINNSDCPGSMKEKITGMLASPPQLPGLWTFFRKLSGNTGKPNIRNLPKGNAGA